MVPQIRELSCSLACIPFGSIMGPTGVTVSLHAKGFAQRRRGAPLAKKGILSQPSMQVADRPSILTRASVHAVIGASGREEGRPCVAKGSAETRAVAAEAAIVSSQLWPGADRD